LDADPSLAEKTVVLPEMTANAEWSLPGGVASNAPGHLAGDAKLTTVWRRDIGETATDNGRSAAPPIIAAGRVYVMNARHEVRAFDARTGAPVWSQGLAPDRGRDQRAIGGGLAFADGRVFASTGYGFTVALDAASGRELWRRSVEAPFAGAPTVASGRVFVTANDSEIFALEADTGDVLWTYQAIAESARILTAPSPAVQADTVIAPFASGELVALAAANGRRLWSDALTRAGRLTALAQINDIAGRPVSVRGIVYAVSHSGVIAAIDERTGQRIWARPMESIQTPLVAGDFLFAVTIDSELVCLDGATGGVKWVKQLRQYRDEEDRKGRVAWAGPLLVGGKLVLFSSLGEALTADPTTGEVVARAELSGPVFTPPVAAGGLIYVVTDKGHLYALN
jgi:outer membrane protein assembly factor BamB